MTGIYKITNLLNGHCYIGQSIDIQRRWIHHKNYPLASSDYPLYRAFQKYGINNFSFEVLEECAIEDLDSKEIAYIRYFNSYKDGYNQTEGGSGTTGAAIKLSLNDLTEIYDLLLHSTMSQRDIAEYYGVGEDTISEINHGKTRRLENYSFPLRNNRKEKKYCIDCGAEILLTSTRCSACEKISSRVVVRPTRAELKDLIRNNSFLAIGKNFGVSDNSIRKWCIAYNLPTKKTEIKKMSDEEWQSI